MENEHMNLPGYRSFLPMNLKGVPWFLTLECALECLAGLNLQVKASLLGPITDLLISAAWDEAQECAFLTSSGVKLLVWGAAKVNFSAWISSTGHKYHCDRLCQVYSSFSFL
jgi:hypothetical protein